MATPPASGTVSAADTAPPVTSTAPRAHFVALRRFLAQPVPTAAAVVLLLICAVSIIGPFLASYDPLKTSLVDSLQGPSAEHWLGTDALGRDVLSRLLTAGRVSLQASILAMAIALAIGLPLGLISGFAGGWIDTVVMRCNDALMSFPGLVLAIVIVGLLGPGLTNAMIAIGLIFAPEIMRIVRGAALSVRHETYFLASRSVGCGPLRLMLRHVLPNVLSPLAVQTTLGMAGAILAESSLSFLGLGVTPPTPSWGGMLNELFPDLSRVPVAILAISFMIALTILAFQLIGDGLRDSIGVQTRGSR